MDAQTPTPAPAVTPEPHSAGREANMHMAALAAARYRVGAFPGAGVLKTYAREKTK